jgi:AraC family transcriptional activator of tynA and feaB
MLVQHNNPATPQLGFEAWRALFRSTFGSYELESAIPDVFSGWLRPLSAVGFSAVEVVCDEGRIHRTHRDLRIDGIDLYGAVFQVAGRLTVIHASQTVQLVEGDVILVDKSQPVSYKVDSEGLHVLCLQFPRRALISHLGFEPPGVSHKCSSATPAGRLLREVALQALESDSTSSPAYSYLQLAAYDLVGALFTPDPRSDSRSTDKLFARIQSIIRDRLNDPDFGPRELAADAGISLRYVHKLFAERGTTCREFIYSLRLDQAARLLNQQGKARRLNEIAYTCGFREYTHFARKFRQQFGYSPSSHRLAHAPGRDDHEHGGADGSDLHPGL